MARFKLKCGAIVQVDDEDGRLLRSRVYRLDSTGTVVTGRGNANTLKKDIVGACKPYIIHRDGDKLNCRRTNLLPMTKEEYARWLGAEVRARHLLGEQHSPFVKDVVRQPPGATSSAIDSTVSGSGAS